MSNQELIEDLIRLGFKCSPRRVLDCSNLFQLVFAVRDGDAKLTKNGRAKLLVLQIELKYNLGE